MNSRSLVSALLVIVVIVWQVPHTIFLRYSLLIIIGVLAWPAAVAALKRPANSLQRAMRVPFAVFGVLLAWSIARALGGNDPVLMALNEVRAEWLAASLVLLMGYGLALRHGTSMVRVAFVALLLHAFTQMVTALLLLWRGDAINLLNFGGISDHKANVTYTNMLALALLVADAAARARRSPGFLGIDMRWSIAAFALLLASTVLATTRNGLIVFALLTFAGLVLVAVRLRAHASRGTWAVLAACAVAAFAGAFAGLKADPRWSSFAATARVAWDTDGNRQWLQGERNESNLPIAANGRRVEPSAYFRIAYLKEGTRLLIEHPWGSHIGRDAFNRAVRDKYRTPAGMSHAHNGFLDLGMSLGIPGVVLWLAFLGALVAYAVRADEVSGTALRTALVLAVAAYAARTALDSTLRDHIIEEFMLVAGLLCGAIASGGARGRG